MARECTFALAMAAHPAYETARPEVAALVPAGARRILDIGCSTGALGAALKARGGAEVVGIERDPARAAAAAARLDRVVTADLEGDVEDLGRFDCLIAADVLEHLIDPWTTLRAFAARLEPGGIAVVSLPNVRYWETFWQLGRRGTWPRRSEGIFDRTHLRWFTLHDAHMLLIEAGLEPVRVERVFRVRPARASGWDAVARRVAPGVPGLRALTTFQHLLVGRRG